MALSFVTASDKDVLLEVKRLLADEVDPHEKKKGKSKAESGETSLQTEGEPAQTAQADDEPVCSAIKRYEFKVRGDGCQHDF